jgi:hypothetical protein
MSFIERITGFEISKGEVAGHTTMLKFGRNIDIDAAAAEDVWSAGGTWVPPTAARTHDIASTDADDTLAGAGAQKVQVYGLDASGEEQNEEIDMNGVANVATASTYTMIHRMVVTQAGATGGNEGTISATAQVDGTVTAEIPFIVTGANQTLMAIYQIPSDKTGYLNAYYASMNKAVATGAADIELLVKPTGEVWQVKHVIGIVGDGGSHFHHPFELPMELAASSLVKIRASVDTNDTDISAGFDITLVE